MKNVIWKASNSLRHTKVTNYSDIILNLAIYKILVDFKNEAEYLRESHKITDYISKIDHKKLMDSSDFVNEINEQLSEIGISFDKSKQIEDTDYRNVLNDIYEIDFSKDIIRGEYLEISKKLNEIKNLANREKRSSGSIATPSSINQIIGDILKVKEGETLLDPCCGSGLMLLTVGKETKGIYGQEINREAGNLGKINLLISNKDGKIEFGDSLEEQNFSEADVVISNPSFGIRKVMESDPDYLNWGVPSKTGGDMHFLSIVLSFMKDRGAIVVPEGVLFRGGKESVVRENIIKDNLIEGVISLPSNIFSHTGIATSLLILNKNKNDNNIFMLDSTEFFERVRGGVYLSDEERENIVSIFKEKSENDGVSKIVSFDEIKKNEFRLTVKNYVSSDLVEIVDIVELEKEIDDRLSDIRELQDRTNLMLSEI